MLRGTHGTYVIAEAGVNHNGDMALADQLVDAAVAAGADAVKFQTFSATRLAAASAGMAAYQKRNTGTDERQVDMLARLELSEAAHRSLKARCEAKGIAFLSSPFDSVSAVFLTRDLGLGIIKVPSGEMTNGPYLLTVARHAEEVILSTGMCGLDDIALALDVVAWGFAGRADPRSLNDVRGWSASADGRRALDGRVIMLHCTTEYPAAPDTINLRAMKTLADRFDVPIGLSDHSEGIAVPVAAVGLGAVMIEKHMTLDRTLPGPDHKASIEPGEFAAMVSAIRTVERSLGTGVKEPYAVEIENRLIARKGLVALAPIKAGEQFSAENMTAMRPGAGLSPMQYWDMLGKVAERNYDVGEQIADAVSR